MMKQFGNVDDDLENLSAESLTNSKKNQTGFKLFLLSVNTERNDNTLE